MNNYFKVNNAEQYVFYKIPKALFKNSNYKTISTESKVLYGLLLDRMGLSIKNNWVDEQGRVYIIYTVAELMEDLQYGKNKIINLYKELVSVNLIEKKKQGLKKPDLIYLKQFKTLDNSLKFEFQTSRGLNFKPQEVSKSNPNKTYNNNTDFNKSSSSSDINTYDKNETDSKIDDDIKNIFLENKIQMTDTNIKKLIKTQNFSLEKLKVLIEILKTQDVKNVVGWLVTGLNNFESFKDTFSFKGNKQIKNKINNFEGHKRDFGKLEKLEFEMLEKDLKDKKNY